MSYQRWNGDKQMQENMKEYLTEKEEMCIRDRLYSDAFIIVENICCQGSVFCYVFYFRSKEHFCTYLTPCDTKLTTFSVASYR